MEDYKCAATLTGHRDRLCSINFHPQATKALSSDSLANLVTGAADATVRLWSMNGESLALKGHEHAVSKTEFHP